MEFGIPYFVLKGLPGCRRNVAQSPFQEAHVGMERIREVFPVHTHANLIHNSCPPKERMALVSY